MNFAQADARHGTGSRRLVLTLLVCVVGWFAVSLFAQGRAEASTRELVSTLDESAANAGATRVAHLQSRDETPPQSELRTVESEDGEQDATLDPPVGQGAAQRKPFASVERLVTHLWCDAKAGDSIVSTASARGPPAGGGHVRAQPARA